MPHCINSMLTQKWNEFNAECIWLYKVFVIFEPSNLMLAMNDNKPTVSATIHHNFGLFSMLKHKLIRIYCIVIVYHSVLIVALRLDEISTARDYYCYNDFIVIVLVCLVFGCELNELRTTESAVSFSNILLKFNVPKLCCISNDMKSQFILVKHLTRPQVNV